MSCYVHLNPLRIAGLGLDKNGRVLEAKGFRTPSPEQVSARLRRLREYRWSSYRAYGGYCAGPSWLHTDELLGRAHRERQRQRAAYRALMKERLTYGVDASRRERLRDVVAIGSANFARRIRESVAGQDEGLAQKRALRRRVAPEEVRERLEELRGVSWEAFAGQRGDPGRALFLWAVRKRCGRTLREAGEAAGGMKPAAVDMAIRRLEEQAKHTSAIRTQQQRLLELVDANVEC